MFCLLVWEIITQRFYQRSVAICIQPNFKDVPHIHICVLGEPAGSREESENRPGLGGLCLWHHISGCGGTRVYRVRSLMRASGQLQSGDVL